MGIGSAQADLLRVNLRDALDWNKSLPEGVLWTDRKQTFGCSTMRGILLWMIGLPIPVIILLYLFHVI